jgi:hypothetical protein
MVEVMALGDEEGGDSTRPARPPLECLLPQEQNAPLPEQDASDITVIDLRAPRDHVIDPVQVAEALERTRLVLLNKVAEDEDTRCRMSTTLRELYDVRGDAPDELAHGRRCSHGLTIAGSCQVQWSPSANQGYGGRGQGSRALSCNARGHRAQQAGEDSRLCQVLVPAPGLGPQARQPALHIHLWLDHMKTLPKVSASSKRAAVDQGGPEVVGSGQGTRRASTPSMSRLTSHANSTAPLAGKRPTPRVSVVS